MVHVKPNQRARRVRGQYGSADERFASPPPGFKLNSRENAPVHERDKEMVAECRIAPWFGRRPDNPHAGSENKHVYRYTHGTLTVRKERWVPITKFEYDLFSGDYGGVEVAVFKDEHGRAHRRLRRKFEFRSLDGTPVELPELPDRVDGEEVEESGFAPAN